MSASKKHKPASPTATQHTPSLSLVIPCYNEASRLENLFSSLQHFSQSWKAPLQVLIVDDGSKDDTVAQIKAHATFQQLSEQGIVQLIEAGQNQGKGGALALGVAAATNDFILTLDTDMSARPQELHQWLQRVGRFDDNTLYIGSREHKESHITAHTSRRIVGNIFNLLVRLFTPLSTRDSQCGFKLYPIKLAKQLFGHLQVKGWAHDVELLYRAHLMGAHIQDMPLTWQEEAGSKVNVARDSIRMLLQILFIGLSMRWQWFVADPMRSSTGKASHFTDPKGGHPLFRTLFFGLSLLLLLFMPYISRDFGITADEEVQYWYGEYVLEYFTSFGAEDKAQMCCPDSPIGHKPANLHYYGGFFDLVSAAVHHTFGGDNPFATRHAMNALFGWLAILMAGLLARRLSGYPAAVITMMLLVLTPRFFGHSMNNPKDIPFAAAYLFTLYFLLKSVMHLPRPGWRTLSMLAAGIAMAIAIRIGGLLLIGYTGLFIGLEVLARTDLRNRLGKDLWRYVRMGAAVIVGGYLGGLVFWPYAHLDPIGNPLEALGQMSQFDTGIRVLFQGVYMMSTEVPWNYELTYMWITFPLVLLAGIALLPLAFLKRVANQRHLLYVVFAAAFPLAYAIYQDSALYDGMRHFLFVIPPIAVLAGIGFVALSKTIPGKAGGWVTAVLLAAGAILPLRFMIANHPNEVVYFNELQGGVQGAFGQYETDYWYNSMRPAVDALVERDNLASATDSFRVITNASFEMKQYFAALGIPAIVNYAKYASEDNWPGYDMQRNREEKRFTDWTYALFVSRYLELEELQQHWPPAGTWFTESADGVPLVAVLKRQSMADSEGKAAMDRQDWPAAISSFTAYLQADSASATIWNMLGISLLNNGLAGEAVDAFRQSLSIRPDSRDGQIFSNLTVAYLQAGRPAEAAAFANTSIQNIQPALQQTERKLMAMQQSGQPIGQEDFNAYLTYLQQLAGLYQNLAVALQQQGNMEGAQQAAQTAGQYRQQLQQYNR